MRSNNEDPKAKTERQQRVNGVKVVQNTESERIYFWVIYFF